MKMTISVLLCVSVLGCAQAPTAYRPGDYRQALEGMERGPGLSGSSTRTTTETKYYDRMGRFTGSSTSKTK